MCMPSWLCVWGCVSVCLSGWPEWCIAVRSSACGFDALLHSPGVLAPVLWGHPVCVAACRAEAEFVLCLYKHMLGQVAELQDGTASVAVISPYKAQVGARTPRQPLSAAHDAK